MSSNENWELKVDDKVRRQIKKFPKEYSKKITDIIELLIMDPFAGDTNKIKDEENTWRRRVGSYRIFYEIHISKRLIHIFWVERRTSNAY